jgi:hypothetical protein
VTRCSGMRSPAALLGCLSLLGCLALLLVAGCASSSALLPEPPFPPPPPPSRTLVIVENEDPADAEARSDDELRQRALHVMADEQSSVLARIEAESRFGRISTTDRHRLSDVVRASAGELVAIEEAIAELDRDDSPSSGDCRSRRAELKDRLRRLATRTALVETAMR